jgi:hypothetical protein
MVAEKRHHALMVNPIAEFAQECAEAGVSPVDALVSGGLHRSTWFRWKADPAMATLRNIEAARDGLRRIKSRRHDQSAA